eukprot:gene9739-11960_t
MCSSNKTLKCARYPLYKCFNTRDICSGENDNSYLKIFYTYGSKNVNYGFFSTYDSCVDANPTGGATTRWTCGTCNYGGNFLCNATITNGYIKYCDSCDRLCSSVKYCHTYPLNQCVLNIDICSGQPTNYILFQQNYETNQINYSFYEDNTCTMFVRGSTWKCDVCDRGGKMFCDPNRPPNSTITTTTTTGGDITTNFPTTSSGQSTTTTSILTSTGQSTTTSNPTTSSGQSSGLTTSVLTTSGQSTTTSNPSTTSGETTSSQSTTNGESTTSGLTTSVLTTSGQSTTNGDSTTSSGVTTTSVLTTTGENNTSTTTELTSTTGGNNSTSTTGDGNESTSTTGTNDGNGSTSTTGGGETVTTTMRDTTVSSSSSTTSTTAGQTTTSSSSSGNNGGSTGTDIEQTTPDPNDSSKILEAVKDLVETANFDCSPSGVSLQSMDSALVTLINLILRQDGFDIYNCDRSLSLGLSLQSLSKILKCAGNDDTLTIKARDEADTVSFVFESPNNERISDFEVKLLDIKSEQYGIKPTAHTVVVKMPSSELQRICRDLSIMGEVVTINASKDGVKFSVSGDNGSGNITVRPTTDSSIPTEQATVIEAKDTVVLNFGLRFLTQFTKATPLSPIVKLSLSEGIPIAVEYEIEDLGYLNFFLAPKVE